MSRVDKNSCPFFFWTNFINTLVLRPASGPKFVFSWVREAKQKLTAKTWKVKKEDTLATDQSYKSQHLVAAKPNKKQIMDQTEKQDPGSASFRYYADKIESDPTQTSQHQVHAMEKKGTESESDSQPFSFNIPDAWSDSNLGSPEQLLRSWKYQHKIVNGKVQRMGSVDSVGADFKRPGCLANGIGC